jgi:hypothetical protein
VDVEKARADLKSTVEEVMRPGFVVENPITHARGAINLDQHASPEQRVLLNRLEALERQVQELGRSNVPAQEIINFLDITAQEPDQWRFETYQEFIRRKLRENLWREREKPSSVKKSNE